MTMTSNELQAAQKEITKEINRWAENNGLSRTDELKPITDGVADADAYLASSPKVMWVLKEPYDELDNDQPSGGGWSITDDCFAKIDQKPVARTWHNIVYVMYGIRHGKKWGEFPCIRDDRSIVNILKEIAYINVSKMPNRTWTSNSKLRHFYEIWKEILWKQIDLYNPDVIIFGSTLYLFLNDFAQKGHLRELREHDVWAWNDKLLLSAYHPQSRQKREEYVNNLIDIITTYYNP